jgi:hypothetical protein
MASASSSLTIPNPPKVSLYLLMVFVSCFSGM